MREVLQNSHLKRIEGIVINGCWMYSGDASEQDDLSIICCNGYAVFSEGKLTPATAYIAYYAVFT
jgi:hypothetical protein